MPLSTCSVCILFKLLFALFDCFVNIFDYTSKLRYIMNFMPSTTMVRLYFLFFTNYLLSFQLSCSSTFLQDLEQLGAQVLFFIFSLLIKIVSFFDCSLESFLCTSVILWFTLECTLRKRFHCLISLFLLFKVFSLYIFRYF